MEFDCNAKYLLYTIGWKFAILNPGTHNTSSVHKTHFTPYQEKNMEKNMSITCQFNNPSILKKNISIQ